MPLSCSGGGGRGKRTPMSVDFDAMLPHIGEMGRYQLGLYLIMCTPATLPAAFLAFNQGRDSIGKIVLLQVCLDIS